MSPTIYHPTIAGIQLTVTDPKAWVESGWQLTQSDEPAQTDEGATSQDEEPTE